ncbi:ATP-dependent DNA helicase RecQ [Paraferrimonas sp. SM1919]|uniref:RecQ family ATP-dependent DNA helicase n=1 Tax=Paraferrimonas sp. SM1919 TaxID=2662263 RepID=UPI0013D14681|nr:RecQ family ATP-dependent DNA helicase [Paraferrimonas sp. SM1919]
MNIEHSLKQHFGFDRFRPGQQQVIEQLLAGHSSLALFATGSGKSLCYQYTATQLPHLTLVVSPLLALIKDQLAFLHANNIAAASIDSSQDRESQQQTIEAIKSGAIKVLMVSVERFKNERFRKMIANVPISMMVVDEAHCISEWGHNFRPDYLKLPDYRAQLNIPLVLLLTATATNKVKKDMADKFAIQKQHCVQTPVYRPNLTIEVQPCASEQRMVHTEQLLKQNPGPSIVYVTLQQTANEVAAGLQAMGINATPYHAGLTTEVREHIQDQFMQGHKDIIVATIAFGMGVDKSNIRNVIHYDLPKSIENYAQEIGRAGRDGQPSRCVLLGQDSGLTTMENFIVGDTPELGAIEALLANIISEQEYGQWQTQILALSKMTDIKQLPLKTLLVQLELMGLIEAKFSYFAETRYKFLVEKSKLLNRFDPNRRQFLETIFNFANTKKIWSDLDVESLCQQHNTDRARVLNALEYLHEHNLIELETKKMTESYQVNSSLNPDTLKNYAQQLSEYCQSNQQSQLDRLAQMMRFFELDSCLSYNLSRYFGDADAPIQCGHCSVCNSGPARLIKTPQLAIDNQLLQKDLQQLSKLMIEHKQNLTHMAAIKFVIGLATPRFSQLKINKLAGFGRYANTGFTHVQQAVQQLLR